MDILKVDCRLTCFLFNDIFFIPILKYHQISLITFIIDQIPKIDGQREMSKVTYKRFFDKNLHL